MDYFDPPDKNLRLQEFREKIKTLPIEELIALAAILKRRTDNLSEEMQVLAEQVEQRRMERHREKYSH